MTADPITVHVNRSGRGTVEVDPASVETGRSFELRLRNHGEPAHVHCRATAALADVVTVEEPNPYVEPDEEVAIGVRVAAHDGPIAGDLEFATGFGANSATVEVTLSGGVGPDRRVDVDEALAKPDRTRDEAPGALETAGGRLHALLERFPPGSIGVIGLAGIALATALAAAFLVGGTAGLVGLGVVSVGIVAAAVLLLR
ncbi:hypothetical protein [Halovivax sp.]|uniref:DUF7524 family protein n=1 Tax=Halovivax sp. TaxID=1935978 RepID=UPI0025C10D14|nr:hypothetical protein [Halovivax sp.]